MEELKGPEEPTTDFDSIILKNYSFLQDTKILDYIDDRNEEIRYLKYVVEAAKEISRQSNILTVLDIVARSFMDRFVPSNLVFILEDDSQDEKPRVIAYQSMKQVDAPFTMESLAPYKFFFSLSPVSVTFKVFEYMIGRPHLTDTFQCVSPSLIVPIMGFDQAYGFIIVGKKVLGDEYTRHEIEYINTLMQFTSISLQNVLHYNRAITDRKTKLYNHAFAMNRLDIELDRVRRYRMEAAVIITDVDHFKKFNDTYGHLTGDKILMRIAQILSESIRKGDIAGRFGGEEFLLILANCRQSDAYQVSERIRKRVENLTLIENGKPISVTISIGIRHVTQDTIAEPEVLLKEADMALYEAKERGRNRCIQVKVNPATQKKASEHSSSSY